MTEPVVSPAETAAQDETGRARDWFLRDSSWADPCWVFAPTNALEQERPICIRWDFKLPSEGRFTSPAHAELLEHSRRVIALARCRSLTTGTAQRATTARVYFIPLRRLVRWMIGEGVHRFADIDRATLLSFWHHVATRPGRTGHRLLPTTLEITARLLVYLHRYRAELGDGLLIDPRADSSSQLLILRTPAPSGFLPYTPDLVAVPLVQGAIEFLETSAVDILCARERYILAYKQNSEPNADRNTRRFAALSAVSSRPIRTPTGPLVPAVLADFTSLVSLLYSACFIVIAYLVGPRASEILALRVGCVRALPTDEASGTQGVAAIVGSIFKNESGYHGRAHEWVAPPPAIHAVAVLEALSEPHRARSGRQELWLRTRVRRAGTSEWIPESALPLNVARTERINASLTRFAAWLQLPAYEGKCWHLSTHQGRKTFARFIALRDRTGLFALAQHLGHRDRTVTDKGYVGNDYALQEDIEQHILEQSIFAWENMLTAPSLGGRAGAQILANRPRFRGTRMKQELRGYARLLVEAGLTLGVCDWGYCVYRQEHSACRGTMSAPNPILREPSTCARCRNFVVTVKHRPYWEEQLHRHRSLLNERDLPRQTLKIARERLMEATKILSSLDTSRKRG